MFGRYGMDDGLVVSIAYDCMNRKQNQMMMNNKKHRNNHETSNHHWSNDNDDDDNKKRITKSRLDNLKNLRILCDTVWTQNDNNISGRRQFYCFYCRGMIVFLFISFVLFHLMDDCYRLIRSSQQVIVNNIMMNYHPRVLPSNDHNSIKFVPDPIPIGTNQQPSPNRSNTRTSDDMMAVIHIGPHKTGTTTIQYEAHRLHQYLQMDGYELPQLMLNYHTLQIEPLSPNHFRLAHCLKKNFILNKTISHEYCDPHFLLAILHIASHKANLLLSAERYSTPETLLEQFQLVLLPWQHNIRIIGYYRRFFHWLISWHNQIMKKKPVGKRIPILAWIADRKKLDLLYHSIYVMGSIPRYEQAFGKHNVYVYNTHQDQFDLVRSFFCQAIPNANHTCQYLQKEQQQPVQNRLVHDNDKDEDNHDDDSDKTSTPNTTNIVTTTATTATTTTVTVKNSASTTLLYQEIAYHMQRRIANIMNSRDRNNNKNRNNYNHRHHPPLQHFPPQDNHQRHRRTNIISNVNSTGLLKMNENNNIYNLPSHNQISNRYRSDRSILLSKNNPIRSSNNSNNNRIPFYNMSTLIVMIQNQHENIWNYTSSNHFDEEYKICPTAHQLQILYNMTIMAEQKFVSSADYDESLLQKQFSIASQSINQLCTINVTKLLYNHPLWNSFFYRIYRLPSPPPKPLS